MYRYRSICNLLFAVFLIKGLDRCQVEGSPELTVVKGGNFSCLGRRDGYHPDPELGCGFFQGCFFNKTHVTRITFVCPPGYRYQEKLEVCELDKTCNPSPIDFDENLYKKKRISIKSPPGEIVNGSLHRSKRQANILPAYLSPAREDAVGIILPMSSDGGNSASTRIPSYLLDYASSRPNRQLDLRPIVIVEAAEPAPSSRRSSGSYSEGDAARSTAGRKIQPSTQRVSSLDQDQGYPIFPRQIMQVQDPQTPYGEIIFVAPQQFGTRSIPQYIYRETPTFMTQRSPQQMYGGIIAFSRGSQHPQSLSRYEDGVDPIRINRIPAIRQQDALPREPPVIFYPSQPIPPLRPSPPEVALNVQPPVRTRQYNSRPDSESDENNPNTSSKNSSDDIENSEDEERYPTPDSPATGFRPSIGRNFERYPHVQQFHPPRSRNPSQEIRNQIAYPQSRIRQPIENVQPVRFPQDLRYLPPPRNVEQERPHYQEFTRQNNPPMQEQQNSRPLPLAPLRNSYYSRGNFEEDSPHHPTDAPQSEVSYLPGVEINDDEIPTSYKDENIKTPERDSQMPYHRPLNLQNVDATETPLAPLDEAYNDKDVQPLQKLNDVDETTTTKPAPRYPAPYYHRVHYNPPPRRPFPFVTSTPIPFRSQYNIVPQPHDDTLDIPANSFIRNRNNPATSYKMPEVEPKDVDEKPDEQSGEGSEPPTDLPSITTTEGIPIPEEPRTTTDGVYAHPQVVRQRNRRPLNRQRPVSRNRYASSRKIDEPSTTETSQVLEGTAAIETEVELTTAVIDKSTDYKPASVVIEATDQDTTAKTPNLFGSRLKYGGNRTRSFQFGKPRSRSVETRVLPNLSRMRHVEAAASSLDEERFSPTRQLSQRHRTRPRLFTFDHKDALPNSSPEIAPSA